MAYDMTLYFKLITVLLDTDIKSISMTSKTLALTLLIASLALITYLNIESDSTLSADGKVKVDFYT